MRLTILGKKLGMSQVFDRTGNTIPVTLIQAGPCTVLQVKTAATDGYEAVQLGFDDRREKSTNKPLKGHFAKSGSSPKRYLRESRVDDASAYTVGQILTAGLFSKGDYVDVTGTSKGKGFAGVMKRHGFGGAKATHGAHETKRGGGSIGAATFPGRVFKGLRMAGQMGNSTVTVQNLQVVDVREDLNILAVKGPVPGAKNGYLVIRGAIKKPPKAAKPAPEPAGA